MLDIIIYLVIYILILLGISYYVSRNQSDEDYLISGRNRGGWQILLSKFAGAVGAGYFITYTGFAYEYGTGVFAMVIGIVAGYLLWAYWGAPRVYKDSKKHKFYTMGDYVKFETKSSSCSQLTNILSSVILFGWLLVGIIGGGKIISDFGILSYELAVLVTVLVVLAYILLAGFKAVIITDVIQGIVIFILLFIVTLGVIGSKSVMDILGSSQATINFGNAFGFLLYGILAVFSFSNFYQLSYAAKNVRKLKHGMSMAVIPIFLVVAFLLVIGVYVAQQVPGLDTGLVFIEALKQFLPASLLPVGIVLFFAGIMSSADTNIYGISSHLVLNKKSLNPLKHIRYATIGLLVMITVLALVFRDIVDVSILTGGMSLTLSIPMIYIICKGKNPKRFIGSTVGGLLGLILGISLLGLEPTVVPCVLLGGLLGLLWNFGK